jgi:hypothetical protein
MSYWTKQRRQQRLCFEAARQKEIISRQRDNVRKALLTFSVVSEICFWLCVETIIGPSSFHSLYNDAKILYEVFKSFGLFVLEVKVFPKM